MLATLAGSACEKPAPPPPAASWPPGTVLVMNGQPISAEEVDRIGSDFALLEPADSLLQLRRLALTNVIFPRIATATAHPGERAKMRELAESYRTALVAGTLPAGPLAGPLERDHKGHMLDVGLEIWSFGIEAEIDRWSPVIETVGTFQLARVKKREPGRTPASTELTIGAFDFPYVDVASRRKQVDEAIDHSHLVIVDESWREVVPAAWIYRMRGETP
jgi:hypothetical protein